MERLEQRLEHLEVGDFLPRTDVVNLANGSMLEDGKNACTVVDHMGVVTHLKSVTINGQWQVKHRIGGKQRHDFLEELVCTNVVAAPRDGGL